MSRILIVEDDIILGKSLQFDLESDGYVVDVATSAREGLSRCNSTGYELLLLDVNLPDSDGFFLYRQIAKNNKIPVIFLTARDMEQDEMRGFEVGADDYITKPFSLPLLRKRIKAVLRRYNRPDNQRFDDSYLRVDFTTYHAEKNGNLLLLTSAEYKLLRYFVQSGKRVLTREILLDYLWDKDGQFVDEHALTVNVGRLRAKIEDAEHRYIKTIYGTGYQWLGEING